MTASGRLNAPRRLFGALAASVLVFGSLVACGGASTEPSSIAVTGVTLDRSTLSLTVGGSPATLVATLSPSNATNTAVTWSSSNSAVSSVSDAGVVSPRAPGTATITVATQDGAQIATCAVTVVAATVAVTGVSLDKSTLDLVAGGAAVKLVATVTPSGATNKNVTWLSSNTSVATVSASGEVTPVAAGTATITVKTVDGGKVATCSVTVAATPVAVTGVKLNETTLTLTVNSTESLVETVEPANATDKVVSWFSDKPGVAEVSSAGVVTAKAGGKATITVTTRDGSHTASCEVTVSQPSKAVTGVALDLATLDLVVGGSTGKLTATVSPADADNIAVTWSSSDEQVATVDAGVVSAVGSGTATITVKTVEGQFTAACAVTVHSDVVTSLTAKAQLTGQIALYWTDPVDENATQIEVIMQSADGPVSRLVELGKKQTAFSSLTIDTSYTFALRVRGASETTSEPVMATETPIRVEKVLHRDFVDKGDHYDMIITDTNGSASGSQLETHDIVMAEAAQISSVASFPMNYRWVLVPGLADPTDPSLVSFKNERYNKMTQQWEETERYLHIHTAGRLYPEPNPGATPNYDQFYNWCIWFPSGATNFASADLKDDADPTFNAYATFAMVYRDDVPGATFLQWLGDSTKKSYLIERCYHAMAHGPEALDLQNNEADFTANAACYIKDVNTVSP